MGDIAKSIWIFFFFITPFRERHPTAVAAKFGSDLDPSHV